MKTIILPKHDTLSIQINERGTEFEDINRQVATFERQGGVWIDSEQRHKVMKSLVLWSMSWTFKGTEYDFGAATLPDLLNGCAKMFECDVVEIGETNYFDDSFQTLRNVFVCITHNPHYEDLIYDEVDADYRKIKLKEWLEFITLDEPEHIMDYFANEVEFAECLTSNSTWEVVWYPDSPVGFYRILGPSLAGVIGRLSKK